MATPSGLSAQFGFADESAYGTAVTVDRFLPFRSESMTDTYERSMADDIIAGSLTMKQEQIRAGNKSFSGSVSSYVYSRSMAQLWHMLLGGNATTGAGPYTHTATPDDLEGLSLTAQFGRPDTGGTVRPFTYSGVKVGRIGLAVTAGEYATMDIDLLAQDVATGTALATASYPAALKRFHANDLAVTIDAAAVCVRNLDLEIANAMDDTRRCVGSATIKEPLRNDLVTVSGSVEIEWTDLTYYTAYSTLDYVPIVAGFTNGPDELEITVNAHITDASQPVAGRGVVYQTVTFEGAGASTDANTVTVVSINGDATA